MKLPDIFKAYDIRGLAGKELTPELCAQIGRALAGQLSEGAVAVGYDMRPESQEYAKSLMNGLVIQGREVWDLGLIPTDMIYFAVGKFEMAGGAVVTASHNPGKYDGIKVVGIGTAELRAAVEADDFTEAEKPGSITEKNLKPDWVAHALGFVEPKAWPKYHIAIDAGNGMAGLILPSVEEALPLQVEHLFYELDGTFPNHPANPVDPKNLRQLTDVVKKKQLDFGIAFDGDGDRAMLVDGQGRQVTGTILTAIIANYLLKKHPGATILYSAVIGNVVPETVEKLGGQAVRTKVGHSFIEAAMREHHALFAGEQSGHMYFAENYNAGSGLIGALVAIQAIAESGRSLAELYDTYNVYPQSGERNFEVPDPAAVIEKLSKEYGEGEQDRLDGLTVRYTDWWFNARPSNTEPLLRLNIEARDEATLAAERKKLLQNLAD